jgi:integrase/recombinase XerC
VDIVISRDPGTIAISGDAGSRTEILPATDALSVAAVVLWQMLHDHTSEATQRAYKGDLELFFAWRGDTLRPEALVELCKLRTRDMRIVLQGYAASQRSADPPKSSATINRRLAAVRSMLRLARQYELTEVDPAGLVKNEKQIQVRDTRGPTVAEVNQLIQKPDTSTLVGKRDYAILVTLWELIIRRAELCKLNIEHFDPKRRLLTTYPKGWGTQPRVLTISHRLRTAYEEYLEARTGGVRLDNGEPIFLNLSRSDGGRLRPGGLYKILQRYGAEVLDRKLTPHQMRHAGATAYAKKTKDMRGLQALGGWARLETAQRYLDDAEDLQGKASDVLSKLA